MTDQSTTITLHFDQSPEDVFNAVTNVRGWWSENIQGGTAAAGDEFDYVVVTEAIPNERVLVRPGPGRVDQY